MIRNGTKPHRLGWFDNDYIRSYHPQIYAGTAIYPQFPLEYLTDNTNWFPDQNIEGQPEGCTNYSQTKLARILGTIGATPQAAEAVTHANANGGMGILASFDAIINKLRWFKWRYIIQETGILDFFDACRLAQVSGLPEQRAISTGSPWFPSWEQAAQSGTKIMPMPTVNELAQAHNNPTSMAWHDYVLDGWSQNFPVSIGQLLYRVESHQGPNVDYLYLDRATLNVVMDLYGTVQVVATNFGAPNVAGVPLPAWFASLWHSWFGWQY